MYYNTCPHCGAHLDPDEHCDCLARVRGRKSAPATAHPRHDGPHEVCVTA
ncbi:MAG: hypothetical protein ACLRVN_03310 [Butyricicoccus sp.]